MKYSSLCGHGASCSGFLFQHQFNLDGGLEGVTKLSVCRLSFWLLKWLSPQTHCYIALVQQLKCTSGQSSSYMKVTRKTQNEPKLIRKWTKTWTKWPETLKEPQSENYDFMMSLLCSQCKTHCDVDFELFYKWSFIIIIIIIECFMICPCLQQLYELQSFL